MSGSISALPEGWVWTLLGEIRRDESKSVDPSKSPDQMFELYSVTHFEEGKPELILGKDIGSNKRSVAEGTVLLCGINPRINRVWVVGDYSNFPKIASTEWRPFFQTEGVEPRYLRYFMSSDNFRDCLAANASGVGGSLMRVRSATFADYPTPLPPLPEQHRLVAKIEELFSDLDAGVEALQKVKAELKRYRQAVLKAAVEGTLTEEGRRRQGDAERGRLGDAGTGRQGERSVHDILERIRAERAKNAKGKKLSPIDTSELPKLPEGWEWVRAELLCPTITKGTTPKVREMNGDYGEVPFIKVYNLTFVGRLDFTINPTFTTRKVHNGKLARSEVIPGDVLINIVGPPLGKVSIVPNTYPEWNVNQAIAIFRPVVGYHPKLLAYALMTRSIMSWAEHRAKTTAGQHNLTLEICRELPLPVMSIEEQAQIVSEVERRLSAADEVEKTVEASLKQAERLRQSILKRAFEGKLVPPACRQAGRIRYAEQDSVYYIPPPEEGRYFVYVLKCEDGSLYKGFTTDLLKRWIEHAAGKGAEWTKRHRPLLVYHW